MRQWPGRARAWPGFAVGVLLVEGSEGREWHGLTVCVNNGIRYILVS